MSRLGKTITTKRALLTSFVVDIIDIATNVVVAVLTGSAVMLAGTMQSVADLTAAGLLLVGHKRAGKVATQMHPFGFGKESYFWALLAAVIILLFTATMSFYSGLQSFLHPEPVEFIALAYIVLALALVTNGYAFTVSARKLLEGKSIFTLPRAFVQTVHIAPRTTFVLDSLGFLAALFGLIALILYGVTGDSHYDGIGAMIIGTILGTSSVILLLSVKAFIIGKRASAEMEAEIKQAALSVMGVESVLDLRTMMLGSDDLLVNLELHFKDGLVTDEIEDAIDAVKRRVGKKIPGKAYIQVEPEAK